MLSVIVLNVPIMFSLGENFNCTLMACLLEYFHFKETVGSVALIYSNRTVTYSTVTASITIFQVRFFVLLHYSVRSFLKWHVYILLNSFKPTMLLLLSKLFVLQHHLCQDQLPLMYLTLNFIHKSLLQATMQKSLHHSTL